MSQINDELHENWRNRYTAADSAREIAYRSIRDKIIYLELKPGEALSDKQLAETLGMSRTPVREALIILSTCNMVVLKPQAGTFVAPIDSVWLETEQYSRCAMEREVVCRACVNMNDEIAALYRENLESYELCERSTEPGREKRMMQLDNEFHRIAFLAADRENNFLHMLNYMQHIERLRYLSLIGRRKPELSSDHRQIAEAIMDGNILSAQYWLESHLNRFRDNLVEIQKSNPQYFELG